MPSLSNLRDSLLSDRVQQLTDLLYRHQVQARNLAILLAEGVDPTKVALVDGDKVCGLCGLAYSRHPNVLIGHVTCSGLTVRFS